MSEPLFDAFRIEGVGPNVTAAIVRRQATEAVRRDHVVEMLTVGTLDWAWLGTVIGWSFECLIGRPALSFLRIIKNDKMVGKVRGIAHQRGVFEPVNTPVIRVLDTVARVPQKTKAAAPVALPVESLSVTIQR